MANCIFDTVPKQKKLAPRGEPYFYRVAKGMFIGYRKGQNAGSWVARLGTKRITIGDDGFMDYGQALEAVQAWCAREAKGLNKNHLLSKCIDDYIADLKDRSGDKAARVSKLRLERHIPAEMMATKAAELTTKRLKKWFLGISAKMKPATANRILGILKAALNHYYDTGEIDGWRSWSGVSYLDVRGTARDLLLTAEQVNTIIVNAPTPPLRALIRAAVLTGARVGELKNAKVKDFKPANKTLKLTGKTGTRYAALSAETTELFKEQVSSKQPEDYLLTTEAGEQWEGNQYLRELKRIVKEQDLPSDTVFYTFRHYHISKLVGAGLPLFYIAENCGTSVAMIEDHYAHFKVDNLSSKLDAIPLN